MSEEADALMSGVAVNGDHHETGSTGGPISAQLAGHQGQFHIEGNHMQIGDADTQRQLQILASTAAEEAIHPELQRLSGDLQNGTTHGGIHGMSNGGDLNAAAAAVAAAGMGMVEGGMSYGDSDSGSNSQQQQGQSNGGSAQGTAPQAQMESTEDNGMNGGDVGPGAASAEAFARMSGYHNLDIESAASTLSKRLAPQPGRRTAVQRRQEQVLNLQRRSNVEALLAHITGTEAASACKNCHKGHGPWNTCVVVEGQMCGSCANCWYNASGSRCSFHDTNNPQAHQPALHGNGRTPTFSQQNSRLTNVNPTVIMGNELSAMGLTANPNTATAAAAAAAAAAAVALGNSGFSVGDDAVVREVVERAFREGRAANTRKRLLLGIESAARELASRVAEYERWYASPEGAAGSRGTGGGGDMEAEGDLEM